MALKLTISGCCGRMGQAIARCALRESAASVVAAFEAPGHPAIGQSYATVLGLQMNGLPPVSEDAKTAISRGDVLIEFTLPEPTVQHVELAQSLGKPMVIGTTGLTDAQRAVVQAAARRVPILLSPNMSIGVTVLFELVELAARRLGPSVDVDIVESHHKGKKDSPSGTAKRLADVVASARHQSPGAIPMHAIRAGEIIGDHTVIFAAGAERIELTHRAQSREIFAQGAVRAAQFVATQPPGLYDMSHVLRATEPGR